MKVFIRITALMLTVLFVVLSVSGCGYLGYRGDHVAAYTLVYSQVPDILGARAVVAMHDPQILLLERDSYDRGLYLYYEDCDEMLTVAIVQLDMDGRVYYYPEESTLSFAMPDSMYDIDNPALSEEKLKSLLADFCTDEMLDSFKAQNDWNSPINEGKLESAEMTSPMLIYRWSHRGHNAEIELSRDEWRDVMIKVAIKNGHCIDTEDAYGVYLSYVSWMATDDYGRNLYYVEGYYYIYGDREDEHVSYRQYYLEMVAITAPDGSFEPDTFMMELEEKVNYQSTIRELKEINGWNQPPEEVAE